MKQKTVQYKYIYQQEYQLYYVEFKPIVPTNNIFLNRKIESIANATLNENRDNVNYSCLRRTLACLGSLTIHCICMVHSRSCSTASNIKIKRLAIWSTKHTQILFHLNILMKQNTLC